MLPRKEKVMLYTAVPRLFRTTYIGYVYEIAQEFPFILLAEELDPESNKVLKNKRLFPFLEKVIPIDQYTGKKRKLWESHLYFSRLAKKIIEEYKPNIIIGGSIVNSFEKYLFRYGRLSGAITLAFQAGFQASSWDKVNLRSYLLWRDTPKNLKLPIYIRELKLGIVKLTEHIKEVIDFWVMPTLIGTDPYLNKSLFHYGIDGWVREFDYSVVFSDKEVSVERQMGRPRDKIMILTHPLLRKSRHIFEKAYHMPKIGIDKKLQKNITVMIDVNTSGHRRDNFQFISESEYLKSRINTIKLMSNILSDWKIFVKPHPTTKRDNFSFLKKYFEKHAKNIIIVDPMEPADKYITLSHIIVGFPTPSTTLLTAMFQDPSKIIIYLDLFHEYLGDEFKNYPFINTIESLKNLKRLIIDIKNNKYKPKSVSVSKQEYKSAADILNKVIKLKGISIQK